MVQGLWNLLQTLSDRTIGGNEKGEVVLQHPEKCIKCGMCEDHCPDYAIKVRREEDGE